jgi:hypothetical protein
MDVSLDHQTDARVVYIKFLRGLVAHRLREHPETLLLPLHEAADATRGWLFEMTPALRKDSVFLHVFQSAFAVEFGSLKVQQSCPAEAPKDGAR